MASATTASAPVVSSMQKESSPKLTGEEYLAQANEHQEEGRLKEARASFEEAWRRFGADGQGQQLWMRAATGLGYANVVLAEGSWPLLENKTVVQVLEASLDAARQAALQPNQERSRALEGQILLLQSQAFFAKPGMTVEDMDAATTKRFTAMELLQESAVEALPWSIAQLQEASAKLQGKSEQLLTLENLVYKLQELWPNSFSSCSLATKIENIRLLFQAWAEDFDTEGEQLISLRTFLAQFVKVAERFDRKADSKSCGDHAPCSGNLPAGREYSEVEKELVMMVSRDGAGNWSSKAEQMREKGMKDVTAYMLSSLWKELKPVLKQGIENDTQQACGHSCSTCPTRETCQVHDAVKDIEDL